MCNKCRYTGEKMKAHHSKCARLLTKIVSLRNVLRLLLVLPTFSCSLYTEEYSPTRHQHLISEYETCRLEADVLHLLGQFLPTLVLLMY